MARSRSRFGEPTAYVTPGYPLFLAALFTVSQATWFIASVQALLAGVAAVLLGAVAARHGGPIAGWAAALIAAVFPHLVFWTGYVLTEPLYVFLIVLAIYALDRTVSPPAGGFRYPAVAGGALALAALTRPIMLGFAVVVLAGGLAFTRWRTQALVGAAVSVLLFAPWVIRNTVVLDAPVVTSTESGFVLWQGNSPGTAGGTRGYVDHVDFQPLDLPQGTDEVEKDRIYRQSALTWMRDNPDQVAALAPKKLWNMWRPTYEGASTLNWAVTLASYPFLLGFGIAGLVLLGRRRDTLGFILIVFVGYHLVVHGLVTGMIRFRLPVEAVLVIPAGVAVAAVLARLKAGRVRA